MSKKTLIIYTGGTIGSLPAGFPDDLDTPLQPAPWEDLVKARPEIIERVDIKDINLHTFKPLLDSSSILPADWLKITELIYNKQADYEAFVVLHGTNTMAYSASALSYLLRGLNKPVIFTGSMRPIFQENSGGIRSIKLALAAAQTDIPEVMIASDGQLLRANRSIKYSSKDYRAFISPHYPPLGELNGHFDIDQKSCLEKTMESLVSRKLSAHVKHIYIDPTTTTEDVARFTNIPNLKGLIISAYGAGEIMESLDLKTAIPNYENLVIGVVSQVPQGRVDLSQYATSQGLLDIGAVGLNDMTLPAALTKLMVLLADDANDLQTVRQQLATSLVGEISV